jgi:hypothetical protein
VARVNIQPAYLVLHKSGLEAFESVLYHMKSGGRNCSELSSLRSQAIPPIICNLQ